MKKILQIVNFLSYKNYYNKFTNNFYRAMHFGANARSWDRMSSVRLSVCPSVCNVGDL